MNPRPPETAHESSQFDPGRKGVKRARKGRDRSDSAVAHEVDMSPEAVAKRVAEAIRDIPW